MEAIFEAAAAAAVETDWPPAGPDDDVLVLQPARCAEKKPNLWFNSVMSCMSSLLSLFGKEDLLNEYDEAFYIKPERIVESKCIGEGAQGKVHLATLKHKNEANQTVAIKYVQQIDDMTARHLRQVNHVNIVKTIGVCINPPKYYIVMEFCENGSLFEYMRTGAQFTPQQMTSWAREIACAMRHLHERNIIHRDLKSPNVLLTANLTAKVSDFGTSRTINGRSAKMTFAGTVNWMAPEVIRAEVYSEKVDVWSFGVVMWELLTLQAPYYKMEQHAIMWGVGTDSVSLPIPMGIPKSIQHLLLSCWDRTYQNRPPFANIIKKLDEIAEELKLFDHGTFVERQNVWAHEARDALEKAYLRSEELCRKKIPAYTRMDLYSYRDLKDKRHLLNLRLDATNELFFEICSVRLALETRERALAKKEKLVALCQCGVRRVLMIPNELSSSSDGLALMHGYRAYLNSSHDTKLHESKLFVNIINEKAITTAIDEPCTCQDKLNGNKIRLDNVESKRDTVVKINGHIGIKQTLGQKKAPKGIFAVAAV